MKAVTKIPIKSVGLKGFVEEKIVIILNIRFWICASATNKKGRAGISSKTTSNQPETQRLSCVSAKTYSKGGSASNNYKHLLSPTSSTSSPATPPATPPQKLTQNGTIISRIGLIMTSSPKIKKTKTIRRRPPASSTLAVPPLEKLLDLGSTAGPKS